MNTRTVTYTEAMKRQMDAIRGYYADKGVTVTRIRKIGYGTKFHVQTETHGWYATFLYDDAGKLVNDIQTIN